MGPGLLTVLSGQGEASRAPKLITEQLLTKADVHGHQMLPEGNVKGSILT